MFLSPPTPLSSYTDAWKILVMAGTPAAFLDCDGEGHTLVITENPESLMTSEPSFQPKPGHLQTSFFHMCMRNKLLLHLPPVGILFLILF